MPSNFVKDVANQTHAKKSEIEHTYKKIEQGAKKSGATNPYAVATAKVEEIYGYIPKKNK